MLIDFTDDTSCVEEITSHFYTVVLSLQNEGAVSYIKHKWVNMDLLVCTHVFLSFLMSILFHVEMS